MLKPFDIIFHKGKTPIARAIRRMTNGNYSHCALLIDNVHLIQLNWRTPTTIMHLSYPLEQYDVYRLKIDLTEKEKEGVILFMRERISTGYDWKLIISRLFNILFGTRIVSSEHKYNCDELIVEALRVQNINLIEDDVEMMTPDTLSNSKLLYKVMEIE